MSTENANKQTEKEKLRGYRIAAISIGILLIAFLVLYFVSTLHQKNDDAISFNIYYRDTNTLAWEKEPRQIQKGSETEMVKAVLDLLKSGPKTNKFMKSIPDYIDPIDVTIVHKSNSDGNSKVVVITFTDSYRKMTPPEALDCTTSLVYTLTELDFIESVHIYIEDEELLMQNGDVVGDLDRTNVALNVSLDESIMQQEVVLYFADEQSLGLVAETRTIETDPNEDIGKFILQALVSGPLDSTHSRLIPSETKVISVNTENAICSINLSNSFLSKLESGSGQETLAIASIVNSLTERQNVKKVQILIDGDIVSQTTQGVDLSMPYERMPEHILE